MPSYRQARLEVTKKSLRQTLVKSVSEICPGKESLARTSFHPTVCRQSAAVEPRERERREGTSGVMVGGPRKDRTGGSHGKTSHSHWNYPSNKKYPIFPEEDSIFHVHNSLSASVKSLLIIRSPSTTLR